MNLAGSATLGWLVGRDAGPNAVALIGTGFCGAFTTYSAGALQSVERGRSGLVYAVGTVAGCFLAAWAGFALA